MKFCILLTVVHLALAVDYRPGDPPGTRSAYWCKKYSETVRVHTLNPDSGFEDDDEGSVIDNCKMDRYTTLVTNGTVTKPGEFPHMAMLLTGSNNRPNFQGGFCAGSLISRQYVLTAAHCYVENIRFDSGDSEGCTCWPNKDKCSSNGFKRCRRSAYLQWVVLGEWDRVEAHLAITTGSRPVVYRRVQGNPIIHPDYMKPYTDIALLKLDQEVEPTPNIRPICLPFADAEYSKGIVTGWGNVEYVSKGARQSRILLKGEVNVITLNTCDQEWRTKDSSKTYKNFLKAGIDERIVCAGGNATDTCQGDSGGPLQEVNRNQDSYYCMYTIIGITSFGYKCAHSVPGLYTRVWTYIDWIENIVWPYPN